MTKAELERQDVRCERCLEPIKTRVVEDLSGRLTLLVQNRCGWCNHDLDEGEK